MDDRFNTAAGWVLFAGIVGLGLSSLSAKYFHGDKPERPEKLGYVIEGAEEEGGAEAGPDLGTLLANADAAVGATAAVARCGTCHTFNQGGAAGQGPNLYGAMGAQIGKHAPGFAYSSALSEKGGTWTFENMDAWLKSPRAFAAGTKMSFAGLSSPEDRANILLYLNQQGGGLALPAPKEAEPAEGEAEGTEAVEGDPDGDAEAAGAVAGDTPVADAGAATSNE